MTITNFPFYSNEKTAIFVDGAYLYSVSRALDFDIDYSRLLKWIGNRGIFLRASYYTVIQEDQEYSSIRPLVDWLDYNGFKVVTKSVKDDNGNSPRRKKPDIHVELAVDAMALSQNVDHIFLFVGDSDFSHLIKTLQNQGKKVSVFGTIEASPSITSDELRRHADHFIEIETIIDDICRDSDSEDVREKNHLPEYIDA